VIKTQLGHLVGALLAVAAMFVLNRQVRPVFDTHYEPQEYVTENGTLSFRRQGEATDLGLMTMHVVTQDLERFGHAYKVRELTVRAVAPTGQTPGIELYVDVARLGGEVGSGAHDPSMLVQAELPVLPTGRLGTRPSFVVLAGSRVLPVIAGSLQLTEVVPEGGDRALYRASGRIEIQVDSEHGVEMITGRIEGKISWDATTGA
jgi:hypothetical protein